jgi:hypothetical protein
MKIIEIQQLNHTNIFIVISHRFVGFPNIVCSGGKMYQLPCQIGKKSFGLKELKQRYHQGYPVYIVESKRVSGKVLKKVSIKVEERWLKESIQTSPF